jgi:polysaccharide chain length determinant protein (PEP-CTERM system associated)
MNSEIFYLLRIMKKEVMLNRKVAMTLYVITAFIFLGLAWNWPRIYTSSSTVLIDQQNILRPLMEGTAITTSSADRARLAREIVFSQSSKQKILGSSDWFNGGKPTAIEEYSMFESIRSRTSFTNVGRNLIRVSYSDKDALRAFKTAELMTDIFIGASQRAKQNESRSAFEFIDKQVSVYQDKLQAAEGAIKNFRSRNLDSSPRSIQVLNDRIVELGREIEDIDLELEGEKSSLLDREKQLSGEKGGINSVSVEREAQLSAQLRDLESQLSTLRLSYLDDYPDIVQLKSQIDRVKQNLLQEIESRQTESLNSNSTAEGIFAQTLRTQISNSRTNISNLEARRVQIEKLLARAKDNMTQINSVEAELAELTRDYTINQDIYQQLMRQRENAHISMNIDIDNEGLSIKIQEPAYLPVTPEGLRFGHIILAGLILSFVVPVGVIFGLSLIDGKVRKDSVVTEKLHLPILASIHPVATQTENKVNKQKLLIMSSVVLVMWLVYAYAIYVRLNG